MHTPFEPREETLLNADGGDLSSLAVLVIWTRPAGVVEGFRRALLLERVEHSRMLEEVERYTQALLTVAVPSEHR